VGRKFSRVGRVKDISAGGLSFEYILSKWPDGDCTQVDIFVSGCNKRISRIPCRLVYEIPVPLPDNVVSFSPDLRPKRCGIEFVGLTEEKIAEICTLIDEYTEG